MGKQQPKALSRNTGGIYRENTNTEKVMMKAVLKAVLQAISITETEKKIFPVGMSI
jgi:hypothetical protein